MYPDNVWVNLNSGLWYIRYNAWYIHVHCVHDSKSTIFSFLQIQVPGSHVPEHPLQLPSLHIFQGGSCNHPINASHMWNSGGRSGIEITCCHILLLLCHTRSNVKNGTLAIYTTRGYKGNTISPEKFTSKEETLLRLWWETRQDWNGRGVTALWCLSVCVCVRAIWSDADRHTPMQARETGSSGGEGRNQEIRSLATNSSEDTQHRLETRSEETQRHPVCSQCVYIYTPAYTWEACTV